MAFNDSHFNQNSINLKKRTGFNVNDIIFPLSRDICLHVLKKCGFSIYYIKDHDKEMSLTAVRENGLSLQFIKKQDIEICLNAIKQNPEAFAFVSYVNRKIINYIFANEIRYLEEFYDYEKLSIILNRNQHDLSIYNNFDLANINEDITLSIFHDKYFIKYIENNNYHSKKDMFEKEYIAKQTREKEKRIEEERRIEAEKKTPKKTKVYNHIHKECTYYENKSVEDIIKELGEFIINDKNIYYELYFNKDLIYTVLPFV